MPTSLLALLAIPGGFGILALWVWHINRGITVVPEDALTLSPYRWTVEQIRTTALEVLERPLDTQPHLPPPTGRRYIIVGGSGFVGGWIIRHLISRGESPVNIRIIDLRRPTRKDIHAKEVSFIAGDIRDEKSLCAAFGAEWPIASSIKGITVFHTVAVLRYYERHASFIQRSSLTNVEGTKNVLSIAQRTPDVEIFIYTSSGSIPIQRTNFWIPPWRKHPKTIVQVINDTSPIPIHQKDFISNYAYTKYLAEKLVLEAHSPEKGFRTGCLRPGSPIYGAGGDLCAGAYLLREQNPSWIHPIIQSIVYVENVSYGHLLYESRLLDSQSALSTSPLHTLGGQSYSITDPGNPISYGDLYLALSTLTDDRVKFPRLPAGLLLVIATLVEQYYNLQSRIPQFLPLITGDVMNLQPSLFDLASVHLMIDDSRARLSPEEGGLGYRPPWTTLQGICQLVHDHIKGDAHAEDYQKTSGGISFKLHR